MADQPKSKNPIIRGARACTTCRAAKMKCIGADEEQGLPCQRCQRGGQDCKFEKHRRGRKPGSKLSDASKMLRRLEKGLNNAKARGVVHEPSPHHIMSQDSSPLSHHSPYDGTYPSLSSDIPVGTEDDDTDRSGDTVFPAQLIRKESERNSFFKTILNPTDTDPHASPQSHSSHASPTLNRSPSASSHRESSIFSSLKDPVASGLVDEKEANDMFEMFFLRLNPFINLFDPHLHSAKYIRARCPFLFTTILMACCKFFKPTHYKSVLKLAHEFAIRAFAENWKSVEVCQAFACLTYWKEPDDQRTWTYIGYACRMAVELGLNKYVERPQQETEFQFRERRNRERTYLVLFVHDHSLSTQTGRQYMLADDDLFVEHASDWHLQGGPNILPQDVILASFVQLRLIASMMTKKACAHQAEYTIPEECNTKMNSWMQLWPNELKKAEATTAFHQAFIRFFWLYVNSFLNSLCIKNGLVIPTTNTGGTNPMYTQTLKRCYESALHHLKSVTEDFHALTMLRYGQDTITVMTAYCAVYLITLLRNRSTQDLLPPNAQNEIYLNINKVAETYAEYSDPASGSSSALYHSRFLRSLLQNDRLRSERAPMMMDMDDQHVNGSHSDYTSSSSPTDVVGGPSAFPSANSESPSSTAMQPYFPSGSPSIPSGATSSAPQISHSNPHENPAMSMQQSRQPAAYAQTSGDVSLQRGLIGNMNDVNGWNPNPGDPSHGYGGHGSNIPGNTPYDPSMSSLTNWTTPNYQSPSEAFYFKTLFKELNMPRGFDSIYTTPNSDPMMEGLGPPSRHHRRPIPGLPQPDVVGSIEINGGYYGAHHPQQTSPPPQQQPYASHQAPVQNSFIGLMR
ncbi:hypothetical protein QCA50_002618 [Cerrena zonata]|uniref:Zn(2)-C6 fungal-type domain-containing protein n=1 Tax=Cerrena zonata TaxID=2478898 RepID=A0AAW0GIA2_9APHY